MAPKVGKPAPDFRLPDETGTEHKLFDYRGKKVVLYFYPADDTPGCTAEACNFRDDYLKYKAVGAVILGVSPNDEKSHQKFKTKYSLPFPLLVDAGHKVSQLYGTWGTKVSFGRKFTGLIRTTFVIDEKGNIEEIIAKVPAAKHSEKVLAILQA